MSLDYLGHQGVHGAAASGNVMQHRGALSYFGGLGGGHSVRMLFDGHGPQPVPLCSLRLAAFASATTLNSTTSNRATAADSEKPSVEQLFAYGELTITRMRSRFLGGVAPRPAGHARPRYSE